MITAQRFTQVFEQVTHEQMPLLLHHWPSQPQFTQYVKNEMMPSVASGLGCYRELEYKRIDIVFKMLSTSESKPGSETGIVAAIEHENNFGGSHQEIAKLCAFNAPLGVLITYARPENRQLLIAKFSEIISASTSQGNASERGEILVIFGPYGFSRPANLLWEHFIHQGDRFRQYDN